MKVVGNSVNIRNGISKIKSLLHSATKEAPVIKSDGSKVLAEQTKAALRLAENYVEPAQLNFPSTKSMLQYSSTRCVDALKKENIEHTVVFNLKSNKVLAEFKGDSHTCKLNNIEAVLQDKENIGVMHGHPQSFPLSYNDIKFLRDYGINQIIAVDENGRFSLVGKRPAPVRAKSKIGLVNWYRKKVDVKKEKQAFLNYSETSAEDAEFFRNAKSNESWKNAIHDTLKTYIPPMNMRYVTNYKDLK